MGTTSRENDHSQEYLYAYQWDLGSNVKLPYGLKIFHYEGNCEIFMVKTTPVTHLHLSTPKTSFGNHFCAILGVFRQFPEFSGKK